MNLRPLLVAACLAASCAAARPAAAQCADACYGGYGGFGGYWDIGRLYGVLANNVPYYAAFPPVYYSYPVPRTYGYSPFAYPPGVRTPEIEMAEPLAITNPYVKGAAAADKTAEAAPGAPADHTTSAPATPRPLEVLNPFVTGSAYANR